MIVVEFEPKNKTPTLFCAPLASHEPLLNVNHIISPTEQLVAMEQMSKTKGSTILMYDLGSWKASCLPNAVLSCNSGGPKDTGKLTLGICERIYYFYTVMPYLPYLPGIYLTLEKN